MNRKPTPTRNALTRDRLERALRICHSTEEACRLLSTTKGPFYKAVRREGLTTPWKKFAQGGILEGD